MASLSALFTAVVTLVGVSSGIYWYRFYFSPRPHLKYRDSQVLASSSKKQAATYGLYKGPGHEFCDDSTRIIEFVSSGQDDCESKCTADKSCGYYSFWPGSDWCRLSTACDGFAQHWFETINIYHKEPFSYLGCYADSGAHDLPFKVGVASIEECAARCNQEGYNFMGRQAEQDCFCGNSFGRYGLAEGCDCYASGIIGWWKQCIYHVPMKCSSGLTIPNSDKAEDAPCSGADGDECAYQCNNGYLAVGRHVCQTYAVDGSNLINHSFYGGRCDKLCDSVECEHGQVPVRVNTDGACLQTTCMEPDAALKHLTKGGYELFQMGRNPKTGIYIDHVNVRDKPAWQDLSWASIDATAVGLAVECVAAILGIIPMGEAESKVLTTLRALAGKIDGFNVPRNSRGFLPTFINSYTGDPGADDQYFTDTTGMFGVGTMFVKTCFENADPDSAATQEISALAEEMNAAIRYDELLCDGDHYDGDGVSIPYVMDGENGCSNIIGPGPDGYYYYNEMIWIVYLAYHQACGKQPKGECNNKPVEKMWNAWQGRRKNLWYYWGAQGLLTIWPSFLLQLPFYLVHAFNSDPVYTKLFSQQWQSEWDYYKSNAFYAGEDGRYGLGAGPTIEWCAAGSTYMADMFVNYTDGTAQFCRMYSPYAVAGYLPANPTVIREHLLALLASGDAAYALSGVEDSDLFVLWRKSLIDRDWHQDDWGITLVDFASEFFGLSTLWLGADFFKKTTDHWPDDLPDSELRVRQNKMKGELVLPTNHSKSSQDVQIEYI